MLISILHTNIESECWENTMTHHPFGKLGYGYSIMWNEQIISHPYSSTRWIEIIREQIIF